MSWYNLKICSPVCASFILLKASLIIATKVAIEHAKQIINEHNAAQQINEIKNQTTKPSNLTTLDLPVLALSLASNILSHNHNGAVPRIDRISTSNYTHGQSFNENIPSQDHQQQIHLYQSIDIAKNSFKVPLEQHNIHFEQHQQHQVIQRQLTQHQGLEIE